MLGQTAIRTPTARVAELMRNLRDFETRLHRLRPNGASSAEIAESIGSELEDIAERFRKNAGHVADEAALLGRRANALGRQSYEFLKGEVDTHPLAVLGVAAGIGLLIGATLYQHSRNAAPPRQRRRVKSVRRRARK